MNYIYSQIDIYVETEEQLMTSFYLFFRVFFLFVCLFIFVYISCKFIQAVVLEK